MDSDRNQESVDPQAHSGNSSEEQHVTGKENSLKQKEQNSLLSVESQDNFSPVQNGLDSSPDAEALGSDSISGQEIDCNDSGDVTDCDKARANGEIFSPDSADMVTVICKADSKSEEEADRGGDGSDTHSDSIETLEEESPHDDSQEQFNNAVLNQICLTNQRPPEEDVFEADVREGVAPSKVAVVSSTAEDSRSTDSHEVIPDTNSLTSTVVCRPESLSLPRPLQYYERNRSSSEPQQENVQGKTVRAEASGGHQRTRSEAIDIHAVRIRGDLGYGDDVMSRSLPHGIITRKGDMIEFVADDLTEKIKRSSPMSRAGEGAWIFIIEDIAVS